MRQLRISHSTFGIDQDEIMAIGDNENDLSMIEYAGLGVAMGNAVSLVKEAANVITSSKRRARCS